MQAKEGRRLIGRLDFGSDLLGGLTEICQKENVQAGVLSVIGAVAHANLGFYNQATKKYIESVTLDSCLEIVSCTGNVSIKESEIFVHAHVSLADDMGKMFGGHLLEGCRVFAAEYFIQELLDVTLNRVFDEMTGLHLWRQ